ncbi:Zn(2)-C6 fungal-type DNA-binding domain [Phaffia rhodozyma]|uniref:Zn(2)-C6 fungal-type DNA-binding domain n=1 Tax=Phaffia rhodozyma TaxID=264483 RepID=A0A0F7SPV0_PHARH|nr:Zn(2)-C6 fungal-type DNA-binding domain [Phaffia rhodozyma]
MTHPLDRSHPYSTASFTSHDLSSVDGRSAIRSRVQPVKAACLACRGRKAKCDGKQPVCDGCVKRNILCEYVKSKRGGSRKRPSNQEPDPLKVFLEKLENVKSFRLPSAQPISDDSGDDDGVDTPVENIVLIYRNTEDVLNAYYDHIYCFLPVLPPPGTVSVSTLAAHFGPIDLTPKGLRQSPSSNISPASRTGSSFLFGCLCLLALWPHPADPYPLSKRSKAMRRGNCEQWAEICLKNAERAIEQAGRTDEDVPLEVIQALIALTVYEFAHKGNVTMMRLRQNTTLQLMLDIGLNESDKDKEFPPDQEWHRAMNRQTFWVCFGQMYTSSVMAATQIPISPFDPRIKLAYPVSPLGKDIWANQFDALRRVCRAYEITLTRAGKPIDQENTLTPAKREELEREMQEMDVTVLGILREQERKVVGDLKKGGKGPEADMVRTFQINSVMLLCSTEINLHRRNALPEVAFFSKRMCGLPSLDRSSALTNTVAQRPGALLTMLKPSSSRSTGSTKSDRQSTKSSSSLASEKTSPNRFVQSEENSFIQQQTLPQQSSQFPEQRHQQQQSQSLISPPLMQQQQPQLHNDHYQRQQSEYPSNDQSQVFPYEQSSEVINVGYVVDGSLPWFANGSIAAALVQPPAVYQNEYDFWQSSQMWSRLLNEGGPNNGDGVLGVSGPHEVGLIDSKLSDPVESMQKTFESPGFQFQEEEEPYQAKNTYGQGLYHLDMSHQQHHLAQPEVYPSQLQQHQLEAAFPSHFDHQQQQQQIIYQPMADQSGPYGFYGRQSSPSTLRTDSSASPSHTPTSQSSQTYSQSHTCSNSMTNSDVLVPAHLSSPSSSLNPVAGSMRLNNRTPSVLLGPPMMSSSSSPSSSSIMGWKTPAGELGTGARVGKVRPWGVNEKLKPVSRLSEIKATDGQSMDIPVDRAGIVLPPGLSLERISMAAHSVVRLEVLHRAASIALTGSFPKALPLCACGLTTSIYCFLLLSLAVQTANEFNPAKVERELESIWTNVRVLLSGLEKYGEYWDGIAHTCEEIRIALDASISLSQDIKLLRERQLLDGSSDDDEFSQDEAEE